MQDTVTSLQADFNYMKRREAKHRDTNESTNSRVGWMTFSSLIILVSVESKRSLNKVLRLCLENEGLGQSLKERLNKTTTFNAREVFEQLDLDQDGYITPKEMKEVLESNDWYVTDTELKLLMGMFDSNRDDRISFIEFNQELSVVKI